ncbi:MAG: Plug domain-containing protein [Gemmatimonadetes bacterium]|nr:Plug domain-containing protein [Gemmatimonadota bacterium]MYE17228.1 Plug domain-containing protein [Gemmatimonadota bacterium]MYG21156.1 Plug domain-containing protein [Gemmatimonadota bacterium]MYJ37620.1 Plug domain-containing protein [Gemmatimonadota bacterium]
MRNHRPRVASVWLLLTVGLLAACYPGRANSGSGGSPDLIGNWELQELADYNALDAIRRLRPAWLRGGTRPAIAVGQTSTHPRVHLNGVPLQNINELEEIDARDIREMRFLNGPDASTRYGTGYMNGAILITLER